MCGQEIPEAFQELIAEPGWRHPDVGMWVWRRRGTYDERAIRVEWDDGAWWVTYESYGNVVMMLPELTAILAQMRRVCGALGLLDEGSFVALSEMVARWGGGDCICVKPAREDQITPAWNPDDYDLVVEE